MIPHQYDHVYNHVRVEFNRMPHGYVIHVNSRFKEVLIKYFKPYRIFSQGDWEFGLQGDDVESMTFEEFYDCKVSSECEGKFKDYRNRRVYHVIEVEQTDG